MVGFRPTYLLIAVAALGLGAAAIADTDPKTVIADRQEVMKGFAKKTKIIKTYAEGEGDQAAALAAAKEIAETAPRLPSLFPRGSGTEVAGVVTHAKPEIWTDWDRFQGTATRLAGEANSLATAIAAGDRNATKDGLAATGRVGCGACHEIFRAPLE
jgi:cytochrome c556